MKKLMKYLVCSAVLLSFAGIVYAASAFMKQPAALEKLQECKSLIPWKPEEVVAFEKAADIKEGALKFESFIVLDQPPKDRDAGKTAKELEKFKAKYVQKGKVPFKVMVSMDLTQKKDSKKVRYVNGKSEIYVINTDDKKVLLKEKVDNAKLCPT